MRTEKQRKQDYFRAKENASKYHWDRMTKEERDWLIAFDVCEYEAERGHLSEAVDALIDVGVVPSDKYVEKLRDRWTVARKTNPKIVETAVTNDNKRFESQIPKLNSYDSSDYIRVMRGPVDQDDLGVEFAYSKEEVYDLAYGVKKETSPDNLAVMINPEDGMIEAIDHAAKKNRSLEKLMLDAKLSKEAAEVLKAKLQKFVYAATTYSKHANLILDMNFIGRAPNGSLWVWDQHSRLQTMELYLRRRSSESIVTHCEVSFKDGPVQNWTYEPGIRSNVEGKAVLCK